MSRFLFATVPVPGHVNPGLPIAHALVQRGHEVRWYGGRAFRAKIEATGAQYLPLHPELDGSVEELDVRYPGRKKLTGLAGMKWDMKHIFVDAIPTQVAELRRILADFPADAILADPGFMGVVGLRPGSDPAYAHYGISALTLKSRDTAPFGLALPPDGSPLGRLRNLVLGMLFQHVLFRDVNTYVNGVLARLGLPPLPGNLLDAFSPYLYLQAATPVFEYPRSDLAPQVHFIGPLLPESPDAPLPAWWGDLHGGKPVVLVNQGTIATQLDDLIVPTLRALANHDVLVIATTGGAPAESLGIEIPANARVEPFVPFGALLPHVDVMITNGGYGGVQFALANGVPLIVAGTTEEKPEIAARVAWSGAGINLKTKVPTPEQIQSAVQSIQLNQRYRYNAERIKADYASHNAPQEAAALLEQLATTGKPVLRDEVAAPPMALRPKPIANR